MKGVLPLILDPLSMILKSMVTGCRGGGGVAGGGLQGLMAMQRQ